MLLLWPPGMKHSPNYLLICLSSWTGSCEDLNSLFKAYCKEINKPSCICLFVLFIHFLKDRANNRSKGFAWLRQVCLSACIVCSMQTGASIQTGAALAEGRKERRRRGRVHEGWHWGGCGWVSGWVTAVAVPFKAGWRGPMDAWRRRIAAIAQLYVRRDHPGRGGL